jgi:uncharacterized protein (TIGR03086 family)
MTMEDLRAELETAYEQAVTVSSKVRPDQLSAKTPCAEMDVSELLDHLVFAARRAARLGHGDAPASEQSAPHVALGDVPGALRAAADDARSGWSDDASLDRIVRMPWGEEYRGHELVGLYLVELSTHGWDLAFATGNLGLLDGDLGDVALTCAQATIRPDYRNDEGNPFGPQLASPDGATTWELLAAFMGREPR